LKLSRAISTIGYLSISQKEELVLLIGVKRDTSSKHVDGVAIGKNYEN